MTTKTKLAALAFALLAGPAAAEGGKTALGVNYPGAAFRIFFSSAAAAEARVNYLDKIFTGGARLYYFPKIAGFKDSRVRPFACAEADYVSFKGDWSKGNGGAFGGAVGAEYFLSPKISVQSDIGPVYVALKDTKSSLTQSGLEFVLNFGVNFYFK